MSVEFERGLVLYRQSRFEQAQTALQQAIAVDPHNAYAHALLALCLSEREQFREAEASARQAVSLDPTLDLAHYARARVAYDRHAYGDATAAIREAIELGPSNPDYRALLAAVCFDQRRWQDALNAAEEGLRLDAEHGGCANLRAMALVKLGRRREAGATIDAALARDPENATTHANRGWTLLEQHDPARALEHFREALRLDPTNDWARQGIVEGLKSRNPIYAVMLRYFLWMSKRTRGEQWGVLLLGVFGFRALANAAEASPWLAPWVLPLLILYVAFVLLTWTAEPLFNLVLRLDRFGRLALSEEQTVESNIVGALVVVSLASLGAHFVAASDSRLLLAAILFGSLIIPVAATFRCQRGWPRTTMGAFTAAVALAGVAGLALDEGLLMGALLGVLLSMWVGNWLIGQQPRR